QASRIEVGKRKDIVHLGNCRRPRRHYLLFGSAFSLGGVRSRSRAIPSRWARRAHGAVVLGWLGARGWSRFLGRSVALAFGGRKATHTGVGSPLADVRGRHELAVAFALGGRIAAQTGIARSLLDFHGGPAPR